MSARQDLELNDATRLVVDEVLDRGQKTRMEPQGDGRDWARAILERDAYNVRNRLQRQSPLVVKFARQGLGLGLER